MTKLTRRQEEFIKNLIDLSVEFDGPIHYSLVAERLGVSPFTAYDMLCMLEEKGVVTSEYQLSAEKSGPGRAERLFYPSEAGLRERDELASRYGVPAPDDEALKQIVIDLLKSGELEEDYYPNELLARIPPEENPELSYCAEVLHIAAVRLKPGPGGETLEVYGPQILGSSAPARERLLLLGGTIFGIVAQDQSCDMAWTQKLLEHLEGYIQIVNRLDPDECDQLVGAFTRFFEPVPVEANLP